MKFTLPLLLGLALTSVVFGEPFQRATREPFGEPYGVGTQTWRYASNLSRDAAGTIEICYAETGSAERVLGRVDVRPFRSSRAETPDLRILFATAEVEGGKRVVLIVGYGLSSGAFVGDVPGLTQHSLAGGASMAGPSGEYNLLGWGDGSVTLKSDGGMAGARGRLFFRYIERA